jgi:hypothetical protein
MDSRAIIAMCILIFVATDTHFRISDMALLCEFMHYFLLFTKYTWLLNNEHIPKHKEILFCASDIPL